MKYKDLIQFEPIESIVQIRTADQLDEARRLVATYVISDEMAERLTELVIPQVQFDEGLDNKGVLVVGNYGTGKSHLMSALSAVAEHAGMVEQIQHPKVRQAAAKIAGKFKVIRSEIGSTTMSLRDIIVSELEEYLAGLGVDFQFPPVAQVKNHKPLFEQMMAAFEKQYPGQGLLLVVDELLDFLRTRADQALILDLSFLREIGEVCRELRFRFIAGVQEALFDNERFSFVADTLRRVKDRFEQVLIVRSDVEYVVAERLLHKSLEQKAHIRAYLLPFARFYGNMNERMEDFVRLFPVHPDYIKTFEQIAVIEKREVFKALSAAIRRILDSEAPKDWPGVIAYDRYWQSLRENPAFRALPDIRKVLDVSQTLEGRIQSSIKPVYRANAVRIIAALAVQRLTLGDIRKKVGLTAADLRDGLCLYDPLAAEMGGEAADDLLTHVETILREMVKIVNGQFITRVEDSGQYFLDVDKDIDHEAILEKRIESLDKNRLDNAYFNALSRILERADTYHPGTHRAWEYELEWRERRASRLGYLFFGTPNQRSTAQPAREFYLYFIQPYDPPAYQDEKKGDEVFWRLKQPDAHFEKLIKRYAAAVELSTTSSGQDKATYEGIANKTIPEMTKWLQEHLTSAFEVSSQGVPRSIGEWIKSGGSSLAGASGARLNVRDLVNAVSAICLAAHFQQRAPEYPVFSLPVTHKSRPQAAQDALRWLRGVTKTQQAAAVLDALELLDGDRLAAVQSRYARRILTLLQAKGHGQVLNRSEMIQDAAGVEYFAPDLYRLEAEWVVVVLGALVQSGEVVMAIAGKKLDASSMDILATTPLDELARFKYIELPKDWNTPALKALFDLVGLAPGKAVLITQGVNTQSGAQAAEIVAQELLPAVNQHVQRLVLAQQDLSLAFWGAALYSSEERRQYQARLGEAKTFLESTLAYNTPGKLKNFSADVPSIEQRRPALSLLGEIEAIKALLADLSPLANYCTQAALALPIGHAWSEKMTIRQAEMIAQLKSPSLRGAPGFRQQALQTLHQLKKEYLAIYTDLHIEARLNQPDDQRKASLLKDPRLEQLRRLASIDLMHTSQLTDFQNRLAGLRSCFALDEADLQQNPICSQCGFKPAAESSPVHAGQSLPALDGELDGLVEGWTQTLLDNLEDPLTQANLAEVVKPEYRARLETFLAERKLPAALDAEFIAAVQEALAGLIKVTVRLQDLRTALLQGGSPMTKTDYRKRQEEYLDGLLKGKDANKVRIVIE